MRFFSRILCTTACFAAALSCTQSPSVASEAGRSEPVRVNANCEAGPSNVVSIYGFGDGDDPLSADPLYSATGSVWAENPLQIVTAGHVVRHFFDAQSKDFDANITQICVGTADRPSLGCMPHQPLHTNAVSLPRGMFPSNAPDEAGLVGQRVSDVGTIHWPHALDGAPPAFANPSPPDRAIQSLAAYIVGSKRDNVSLALNNARSMLSAPVSLRCPITLAPSAEGEVLQNIDILTYPVHSVVGLALTSNGSTLYWSPREQLPFQPMMELGDSGGLVLDKQHRALGVNVGYRVVPLWPLYARSAAPQETINYFTDFLERLKSMAPIYYDRVITERDRAVAQIDAAYAMNDMTSAQQLESNLRRTVVYQLVMARIDKNASAAADSTQTVGMWVSNALMR